MTKVKTFHHGMDFYLKIAFKQFKLFRANGKAKFTEEKA